ncbi:hypothetical protein D3C71_2022100 [compost metagenome]
MRFKLAGMIVADEDQLFGFRTVVALGGLVIGNDHGIFSADAVFSGRGFGLTHASDSSIIR